MPRPTPVGAVDLGKTCRASMKSTVSAPRWSSRFAAIEKPERAWEGDGVEEVRADGDHHVHGASFDELAANFLPDPRASVAELAMTKPARPFALRAA